MPLSEKYIPVNSRAKLVEHIKHSLGEPVVQTHLADEHYDIAINDALELFWEWHNEGFIKRFVPLEVTQDVLDDGYFTIPDNITDIIDVLPLAGSGNSKLGGFGTPLYHIYTNIMNEVSGNNVSCNSDKTVVHGFSEYVEVRSMLSDMYKLMGNSYVNFVFIPVTRNLIIDEVTRKASVGDFVVIEAYEKVTEIEDNSGNVINGNVYNISWIKRYSVARATEMSGRILSKYNNLHLSSGQSVNGEGIKQTGSDAMEKLEQELEEKYMPPVMFFTG